MFGYVRPLIGRLEVGQYELYKAVYCGLCHQLGKKYGALCRFSLNYDITFLALVLLGIDSKDISFERRSCIVRPFGRRCAAIKNTPIHKAAGIGVILTHWKILDNLEDSGFWKSVLYRPALMAVNRAYKRSCSQNPDISGTAEREMLSLGEIEREKVCSIDIPADRFACILASFSGAAENTASRRALSQMLYHIGRWIYIMDAVNDLDEDFLSGNYNPVILRYGLNPKDGISPVLEKIEATALLSIKTAASAFELIDIPLAQVRGIIENIIYKGLPFVQKQVLCGEWNNKRQTLFGGNNGERPL